MRKICTYLALFVGFLFFAAFQTENTPIPKEKILRFIDKVDPNGKTVTIAEKDYTGDLKNLPAGTLSKVDVRVNAQTGEIVEQRLLVFPK